MALAQVGLGSITQVPANHTRSVYTVGSAKTAYIRAFEIHSLDSTNKATVQVHIVPTQGSGVIGTASTITRIARLGISTEDTYFFENAYPITLNNNGDSIQVYNENTADAVNVLVLGDREG
jgi:hypothetical protein